MQVGVPEGIVLLARALSMNESGAHQSVPWGPNHCPEGVPCTKQLTQSNGAVCSDDERTDAQLPLLVTAAVDAIHLRRRLDLNQDVQVSGQVVWTGKSAMDIRMQLTQVRPLLPWFCIEWLASSISCRHRVLVFGMLT